MTTEPTDEQIEAVARELGDMRPAWVVRSLVAGGNEWAEAILLLATERAEHEAFRREVSEWIKGFFGRPHIPAALKRFILPPLVDPRVTAARKAIGDKIASLSDDEILKIVQDRGGRTMNELAERIREAWHKRNPEPAVQDWGTQVDYDAKHELLKAMLACGAYESAVIQFLVPEGWHWSIRHTDFGDHQGCIWRRWESGSCCREGNTPAEALLNAIEAVEAGQ